MANALRGDAPPLTGTEPETAHSDAAPLSRIDPGTGLPYTSEGLMRHRVSELRRLAHERGVAYSGLTKARLAERIADHLRHTFTHRRAAVATRCRPSSARSRTGGRPPGTG